jgi:hypothetical protein
MGTLGSLIRLLSVSQAGCLDASHAEPAKDADARAVVEAALEVALNGSIFESRSGRGFSALRGVCACVPTYVGTAARLLAGVRLKAFLSTGVHAMAQANPLPSRSPSRTDSAAPGVQWERLYESALLELNPQRVPVAITVARRAMLDRAEEIMTKPASHEHAALNSALRILRTLEELAGKEAAGYHAA